MLRSKLWYQLPLYLLLFSVSMAVMVLSASYLYLVPSLPSAENLKSVSFQTPLRIYAEDGNTLIGEFGEQHRTPIEFQDIPNLYIQALTAAEDDRFFEHSGVEIKSLTRAVYELAKYRRIRSGGSTITMQVARNFFLSRDQTFLRKFNEIILSLQIENLLSKEDILTLYVNKIYLGQRAYGIAAAAQVYYGKSLDELTLDETAMIAGLPKAPSSYNPISNPERAIERRNWVLSRMHKLGHINDEEYAEALNTKNHARYHHSFVAADGEYMAEMARRFAVNEFGANAYTNGLRIITTLDKNMQRTAVTSLRKQLHNYDERHGWRGSNSSIDITGLPSQTLLPTYSDVLSGAATQQQSTDKDSAAARDTWRKALSSLKTIGQLEPVVVTKVEGKNATIVFKHGTRTTLAWESISWARRYVSVNERGPAPQQASDILAVNDVVYVRPILQGDAPIEWHLAQVPSVEGAIVAIDPTSGAIKAMQGGYSFNHSKYNRVVQAKRQTGSVFKPFIYSIAMLGSVTPGTVINDAPVVLQEGGSPSAWRPMGASRQFYGPTPVREALYRSLNLVSVRLLLRSGIDNTLKSLSIFGFQPGNYPRELAISLGSGSNTPLEMAAAYSVFANGGFYIAPWYIDRVEAADGTVLWVSPTPIFCEDSGDCDNATAKFSADAKLQHMGASSASMPKPLPVKRSLEARNAWLMDSMLKDVISRGTGRKAASINRSDIAGKTGTTNNFVDAWFVGYTPALSSAVWIGFDQPQSLGAREYGGEVALPAWANFMEQALKGVPETSLPMPDNITEARINRKTGYRTNSTGPGTISEYFPSELVPGFEYVDPFSDSDDERFSGEQTQVDDLF